MTIKESVKRVAKNAVKGTAQAIRKPTQLGIYGGLTAIQAQALSRELSELDILMTPNFKVELSPYDPSSKIAKLQVQLLNGLHQALATANRSVVDERVNLPLFAQSSKYGQYIQYLATDVDVSLLDAQSDGVQVGSMMLNHLTGNSTGEISITFIETRNAMILNSAKAIAGIMFNSDGTQAPPIDYLMKLKISAIDRHNHLAVFDKTWVVSLQTGSISFSSGDIGRASTQLNFVKMFPMLA